MDDEEFAKRMWLSTALLCFAVICLSIGGMMIERRVSSLVTKVKALESIANV